MTPPTPRRASAAPHSTAALTALAALLALWLGLAAPEVSPVSPAAGTAQVVPAPATADLPPPLVLDRDGRGGRR